MKDEILSHLDNPHHLEKMYRTNRLPFKRAFTALYPEVKGHMLADFWNERLNYESDEIKWGGKELWFVIILAVLAGFIAKFPAIFEIEDEFFYPRNIGFILFPALTVYFGWKNGLSLNKIIFIAGSILASVIFINALPDTPDADTLILSCIHMIIVLWSLLGLSFVGKAENEIDRRLAYLSYNGDLIVMTTLIVIAAGILSGVTIGLFALIGLNIEEFYFNNIVVFGLPAAPILGTYLTQTNPQLVGKVSPVIARIFSPLVLVMLVVYLIAMAYSGKDPYNDREFLLIFNGVLIGVMAIIFFSVAEASRNERNIAETWILTLLCIVTIVVNGIALSAILFRISEWGSTPNRIAVLGGNVLVLINLLLVTFQLFRVLSKKTDAIAVGKPIAWFLPVYFAWAIVVTFLFPFMFGFK